MIKNFTRAGSAVLLAWAATVAMPAAAAPIDIDVRIGPPAPRYEVAPAPRSGYVWTPGYWDWRYNRHHWVPGNWVGHRPGYVYTQPTWVNDNGRWHLYRGAWARGYGDRDRDGIPNRYDRDRDGDGIRNRYDRHPNQGWHGRGRDRDRDGVPNRYDRDRDGDGVRNRNDRRPDNPNRR